MKMVSLTCADPAKEKKKKDGIAAPEYPAPSDSEKPQAARVAKAITGRTLGVRIQQAESGRCR